MEEPQWNEFEKSFEESQRVEKGKSFREFCEKLAGYDKAGLAPRPSLLRARGNADPLQDIPDMDGKEFDRLQSVVLLEYVEARKKDFPDVAKDKEYDEILKKAEDLWKKLAG